MISVANIVICLVICAALYCILKLRKMIQRMTPDTEGVTVLERCELRGKKTLPAPIAYPLSSIEIVNSVIPIMVFFKETLDTETLKDALSDCLDDVPIFQARVRLDSEQQLVVLEANNGAIQLKVQSLKGHDMATYKRNNA